MARSIDSIDFRELFERYEAWVYKTAYLIVGNHHKAEDITQDVFVRAYKSRDTYDQSKGQYSSWLRRITVNQCLKQGKKDSRKPSSIEELEEKGQVIADESSLFTEEIVLHEEIQRFLGSLSSKYRTVLILRFYEDLSYKEIAELLDIPIGTVKSRINAAITSMERRATTKDV